MEILDIMLLHSEFTNNLILNAENEEEEVEVAPTLKLDSHLSDDSKQLSVLVGLKSTDEKQRYCFQVEYIGFFSLCEEDQEHLDHIRKIVGPSIILPYVREAIADLSRRAGHDAFNIPPINFHEVQRQADSKNKK